MVPLNVLSSKKPSPNKKKQGIFCESDDWYNQLEIFTHQSNSGLAYSYHITVKYCGKQHLSAFRETGTAHLGSDLWTKMRYFDFSIRKFNLENMPQNKAKTETHMIL